MKPLEAIPQAVSAAVFKAARHITENDDDTRINGYLQAAQAVVEDATRRPLGARSVAFQERVVGSARWWFPVCPVASLTAVAWQGEDGGWTALDQTLVRLEMPDDEPQLVFPSGFLDAAPDGGAVRITASVGLAAVPERAVTAIILLAGEWHEAGFALDGPTVTGPAPMSFGVKSMLRQMRYARPHVRAVS